MSSMTKLTSAPSTYEDWKVKALEKDRKAGAERWKEQDSTRDFDFRVIRRRYDELVEIRAAGDVDRLIDYFNEGIHGNMGGMGMAGGPRMAQLSFADLDANGDGQLTLEELTARPADHFASADTDGDGGLSADEMTAMMMAQMQDRVAAMAAQMITRLDANKDGLVQADEMKPAGNDGAGLERMFAIMDINGDGAVSQEEFDLVTERLGQMQQRMGQRGGDGQGMQGDHDDDGGGGPEDGDGDGEGDGGDDGEEDEDFDEEDAAAAFDCNSILARSSG